MEKIFIFTLKVIGYMSFTLSTNPPISSSTAASEFNSQVTSTVNSGAVNSALLATQASNASFQIGVVVTSYVDPTNGQLYATGGSSGGSLGLGYDEDGNGITGSDGTNFQQSFTPMIKSGDANQPFINPIDWDFSDVMVGAIIDDDGKLWTAGTRLYGVGNGEFSGIQYTFEMVQINGSYDYNAISVTTSKFSTIVMLDDGTLWGAGSYNGLGLSSTGGVTTAGVEGGWCYTTFIQIDNTSEDAAILHEIPFDASEIVDIKGSNNQTFYLLEDGSLYRCNQYGYTLVGTNVSTFDSTWNSSYYVNEAGDVYYASSSTAAYTQIYTIEDMGTFDSIYTSGGYYSIDGWSYITTEGDVYYCTTPGYTEGTSIITKIAEDVAYYDMGGWAGVTFGAITKSGEFKLWGNDSHGMLGNGTTEGATEGWDNSNPSIDVFESEVATPSTPTTDGNDVTPPSVDPETGELQKDEDGNNVAIIPTLSTPAPAF